ncbi:MAG: ATP-binding protein [Polyangiales bacterium]|nr:response regulator [Sandaracinaceae bacterium]
MSSESGNLSVQLIAELAEVRAQLHSVIGSMPIVLWAVDMDGIVTLSEGQALMSLGLEPGQLVGQSVHELYADAPEALAAIVQALRGEANAAEVSVGGRRWSNRYFPRLDADGTIVGLTGLSVDVTESKALELETRRLEDQMRHAQRLESLGLLAGGIAHDFNNLLAVILGSLNLLARDVPAVSRASELVQQGERAALRAAELTHQMLVYAGRGHFRVGLADLNALITDMGSLIASGLSKRARLTYALDPALPPVSVDAAQIQQVIMNLLTNASDALGGGEGTIHVTSGSDVDPSVPLPDDYPAPHGVVFFEVTDSGAGMGEETQRRIFEPFFTTKETGRGLGLSAVLGIVRGHHGRLDVRSAEGEGTTFRVTLPAGERSGAPEAAREAGREQRASQRPGTRILLVDDEDMVRSVVREVLVQAGFEVSVFGSSTDAAAHAAAYPGRYAAAVVDVVMPGMTGNELVRALRTHSPQLPIVMMSGLDHTAADAVRDAPERTVFLQKPFALALLVSELTRLLG